MAEPVPERLVRAVELLDPPPDARVLEIGPGSGASLDLLCRRVPQGHVTGLDRSATAVRRALRRNAGHVAAGRLAVREGSLADLSEPAALAALTDLAEPSAAAPAGPFDRVLAVNVNVFWTEPAVAEVRRLREVLAPDGVALLVYELPDAASTERCAERAPAALEAGGLAVAVQRVHGLLAITARHR